MAIYSKRIEGLENSKEFFAKVFTVNHKERVNNRIDLPFVSVIPKAAPSVVTNLRISGDKLAATISWANPSHYAYYQTVIVQKTGSASTTVTDGKEVYRGAGTSVSVSDLPELSTVYFTAFTVNEYGEYSTGVSQYYETPKGGRLPTGYTELTYIRSSGTQYIDTGFKPNQNTKIVIDLQPNIPVYDAENFDTWFYLPFSAYTRGYNDSSFDICIENEKSEWAVNWSTDDPYSYTGTGYEVFSYTNNKRITISLEKTKVTLDGDTRNWTTANIQSDITLYLFAGHTFDPEDPPSYAEYYTPMKLYSCQIYDNGTLVRDFVPAKNSNNVVGLYDIANSKFYTNAGSGNFTAGAVVE